MRLASISTAAAAVLLTSVLAAAAPTTNPAGTLHAGDVVEITIYDLAGPGVGTPCTVRLDEKGRVKLPLLDEVAVAGQTTDAAAGVISKAYKEAAIINNGVITIAIVSTAAQSSVKSGPLAVGDTLRVTVMDLTGPGTRTTLDAAVAPDGTITLPLAGKVRLLGQSDGNAGRSIAKAYRDANLIGNPMVVLLRTASAG